MYDSECVSPNKDLKAGPPNIQGYFCVASLLSKGFWKPKTKTTHFSGIIKQPTIILKGFKTLLKGAVVTFFQIKFYYV